LILPVASIGYLVRQSRIILLVLALTSGHYFHPLHTGRNEWDYTEKHCRESVNPIDDKLLWKAGKDEQEKAMARFDNDNISCGFFYFASISACTTAPGQDGAGFRTSVSALRAAGA
jgi:hypothetical protein